MTLLLTSHPGDLWLDIKTTGMSAEGGVSFKNGKKPLSLLHRVIKAHPKKNALVLDFFAGSGTTGEATLALNAEDQGARRFILVTNNEDETDQNGNSTGQRICRDICYRRLQGALSKYGGSLRYFVSDDENHMVSREEASVRDRAA